MVPQACTLVAAEFRRKQHVQCYFLPQGIMGNKERKHTIHPPMSNPLRQSTLGSMSLDFHHVSQFFAMVVGSVQRCAVYFLS